MVEMKIVLLRHSATKENLEHRFIGVTDVGLSPEGAAQAVRMAPEVPEVEKIYVSPLIRCIQTAVLIWPGVQSMVVEELRETDFGPFEGKTHEQLVDDEMYNLWLSCPEDPSVVPMVEDIAACGERASTALKKVVADAQARGYGQVGIVSHGGTLMSIMARHGRPSRDYYSWRMPNGGGYITALDSEGMLLHVEGGF